MPDTSLRLDRASAYDYDLPAGRIARYPAEHRDESRLLSVGRNAPSEGAGNGNTRLQSSFEDLRFRDLPTLLGAGDLVVVNDSRVFPARLLGRKPTGAECEVLLVRPLDAGTAPARWEALVRPGAKLRSGARVVVAPGFDVVVEAVNPDGTRAVRLESEQPIRDAIEQHGRVPLPPYIDRSDEALDRERYQTVYANQPGSVAAPTAGLHFTRELLDRIRSAGVGIAGITLHVGPGTFRPVEAEAIRDHRIHSERWIVPEATAELVTVTRTSGGRVWAVGTTVVRALESAADASGQVRSGEGRTDLFIAPGYEFRVVDGLVTNFHLPRSTLLMLVAAFAGHRTTMEAYRYAVDEGYRFYSYGDAMVIRPWPESR